MYLLSWYRQRKLLDKPLPTWCTVFPRSRHFEVPHLGKPFHHQVQSAVCHIAGGKLCEEQVRPFKSHPSQRQTQGQWLISTKQPRESVRQTPGKAETKRCFGDVKRGIFRGKPVSANQAKRAQRLEALGIIAIAYKAKKRLQLLPKKKPHRMQSDQT